MSDLNETTLKTTLKNVTNGKKIVNDWLSEKALDTSFNDSRLMLLLSYHPNGKVKNPEYLVIRIDPTYKRRQLFFKDYDTDEDSVSYISCIENLFGRYKRDAREIQEIVKAFRLATFDNKHRDYYIENTKDDVGTCSYCNKMCGKYLDSPLHIDHVDSSFHKIFTDFYSSMHIDIAKVNIQWKGSDPILTDTTLQEKWITYHNLNVKYRILCGKCNMSFGKESLSV